MAAAQRADASITAVRTATTGLVIRDIPLDNYGNSILCDISTGRPRPLVPDTWQRTVFDAVHDLSHPSIRERNNWSRLSLYGLAYGSKSASGRKLVFVVKRPKYIDTLPPQWTSLFLRHAVSITSTST